MTKFQLANGNNMPLQAPLIPDPFVPYSCPGNRTLSAVCKGDPEVLSAYLENTPFTLADDRFLVYVADFTNCAKLPFMDSGIVIPVEFEGKQGGYFLFEYEDEDGAIAAGRDLWGYPKKFGVVTLDATGTQATAKVVRKGVTIIEITCELDGKAVPAIKTTPHLNLHVQPGPDGKVLSKRVIERDTSPDFQLTTSMSGPAQVTLRSIATDPLAPMQPLEVLGATYVVGNFFATEENGWGKTVAEFR